MASGSSIGSASSLSSNQGTFGKSSSTNTASSNWSNLSQSPSYGSSYDGEKQFSEVPKNARYAPSPKHEKGGPGTPNPVRTKEEGQKLLETGYKYGEQIYNITKSGKIIVYQRDNTGGYHCYELTDPNRIPTDFLRKMVAQGKITKAKYNKFIKNKVK